MAQLQNKFSTIEKQQYVQLVFELTSLLRMYKNNFCVCGELCAMSGKQEASVAVILSYGRRLWNAAPSKPEYDTISVNTSDHTMFA